MSIIIAGNVITDLIEKIRTKVKTSKRYAAESGPLRNLIVSPNRVTVIGGAPGAGKSSLMGQFISDFLRLNQECTGLICNVEMTSEELMVREIARISGVNITMDRESEFSKEELERIQKCTTTFSQYSDRLFIMPPPVFLCDIEKAISDINPDLIIVDYLQRVNTGDNALDGNERLRINRIMTVIRELAVDRAIIVISALKRHGKSNYDSSEVGLASFRETSEIEYSVNDAYLLVPDDEASKRGCKGRFILRHEKARGGQRKDIHLSFDGLYHRWQGIDDDIEDLTELFTGTFKNNDLPIESKIDSIWNVHRQQKELTDDE